MRIHWDKSLRVKNKGKRRFKALWDIIKMSPDDVVSTEAMFFLISWQSGESIEELVEKNNKFLRGNYTIA